MIIHFIVQVPYGRKNPFIPKGLTILHINILPSLCPDGGRKDYLSPLLVSAVCRRRLVCRAGEKLSIPTTASESRKLKTKSSIANLKSEITYSLRSTSEIVFPPVENAVATIQQLLNSFPAGYSIEAKEN